MYPPAKVGEGAWKAVQSPLLQPVVLREVGGGSHCGVLTAVVARGQVRWLWQLELSGCA